MPRIYGDPDYGSKWPRTQRVVEVEGEVVGTRPFGGFNEMPDAQKVYLRGKMEATVAAIRGAFLMAKGQITSGSLLASVLPGLAAALSAVGFGTSISREAVLNSLIALQGAFEQNVVGAMPRVYAGELEPDRWFNMTKGYVDTIASMLGDLNSSGGESLLAFFNGTWDDIKAFLAKFKRGVENTFDYMPLIVGGAALLGTYLVVTRFLPPKNQLSGYRRRSRLRLK